MDNTKRKGFGVMELLQIITLTLLVITWYNLYQTSKHIKQAEKILKEINKPDTSSTFRLGIPISDTLKPIRIKIDSTSFDIAHAKFYRLRMQIDGGSLDYMGDSSIVIKGDTMKVIKAMLWNMQEAQNREMKLYKENEALRYELRRLSMGYTKN